MSLTGEMEYTDWNVEWNGGIELDYLLYILTTSKILMADQSFILHGNVSQHILLLILSTSQMFLLVYIVYSSITFGQLQNKCSQDIQ